MKIVKKKSYDQLLAKEKCYRILNHYCKLILRQSYDSLIINLKIFCKSGPRLVSSMGSLYGDRAPSWFALYGQSSSVDQIRICDSINFTIIQY